MNLNFFLRVKKHFIPIFFVMMYFMSPAVCFSQDSPPAERFVQVDELSGEVQLKVNAGESWKIAEKGMRIQQGGEIRTGKDSKAVILVDENAAAGKVDIYANTWVRVGVLGHSERAGAKRTLFDLALGQVFVKAQGVSGDGTFQIRTPTSTSSVRGESASFEVKVEEE
ncbi:MAG TPA: FecR domain-containing protein [Candidatus Omnitrophota bacterium]|nr:hypothetical protein [Candidatus Omnitrophota bacterium]HRK62502.1 FecR domain-containing protein [Candidatus Omnitrophota bacterium]